MHVDQKILGLIDELEKLRTTRDDHWQIPRAEGEVLFQIAVACGAKKIIEFGTSYGFSTLFWGAAVQQTKGVVHTIDIDPRKFELSKENFRRAGLENSIVNHLGDSVDVAPTLPGPIDIGFIDAFDKANSQKYFELLWPKVRIGGSILVDNATTHREELAGYVGWVRARTDAASTEIPVGNGIEWTVKLR